MALQDGTGDGLLFPLAGGLVRLIPIAMQISGFSCFVVARKPTTISEMVTDNVATNANVRYFTVVWPFISDVEHHNLTYQGQITNLTRQTS